MTKKLPKADIDFERDLWKTADIFRGDVAENHYRYDVLSLVLIKRLSDRYEVRKEELQHKLEDLQSNYNNIDKEERSFVLEYADESIPKNELIMPKEASWHYLQDNAGQDDITVKVDWLNCFQERNFRFEKSNALQKLWVKI